MSSTQYNKCGLLNQTNKINQAFESILHAYDDSAIANCEVISEHKQNNFAMNSNDMFNYLILGSTQECQHIHDTNSEETCANITPMDLSYSALAKCELNDNFENAKNSFQNVNMEISNALSKSKNYDTIVAKLTSTSFQNSLKSISTTLEQSVDAMVKNNECIKNNICTGKKIAINESLNAELDAIVKILTVNMPIIQDIYISLSRLAYTSRRMCNVHIKMIWNIQEIIRQISYVFTLAGKYKLPLADKYQLPLLKNTFIYKNNNDSFVSNKDAWWIILIILILFVVLFFMEYTGLRKINLFILMIASIALLGLLIYSFTLPTITSN